MLLPENNGIENNGIENNGIECNICYDFIENDVVINCGNNKCNFNMCIVCSKSYKRNNDTCPQCRQSIKDNTFISISPSSSPPPYPHSPPRQGTVIYVAEHREITYSEWIEPYCNLCTTYVNNHPENNQVTVGCCNRNIVVHSWKINNFLGCCVPFSMMLFGMIVPKIIGYYICNGCPIHKVDPYTAWRTCNRLPDLCCQPIVGFGALVATGYCGQTCHVLCCKDVDQFKRNVISVGCCPCLTAIVCIESIRITCLGSQEQIHTTVAPNSEEIIRF